MLARAAALLSIALLLAACGDGSDPSGSAGCAALDDPEAQCRFVGVWSGGEEWRDAAVTIEAGDAPGSLLVLVAPLGTRPRYQLWAAGGATRAGYRGAVDVSLYFDDVSDEGMLELELLDNGQGLRMAADGASFFGPATFEGRYGGR